MWASCGRQAPPAAAATATTTAGGGRVPPPAFLGQQPARCGAASSSSGASSSSRATRAPVTCSASSRAPPSDLESVADILAVRTTPTPRLSAQEVVDSLFDRAESEQSASSSSRARAFYSSEVGGIVTDAPLMMVHVDDRMVHRGTAVFDTAQLVDGQAYQLDAHLDRLLSSAQLAGLAPPMGLAQLKRTVLETCAASKLLNGYARFWLSAGRAGFGLSPLDCDRPSLYCAVYEHYAPLPVLKGWRVKTSPIAPRPLPFCNIKGVEYLAGALALGDAQADGYDQAVFVDADGSVCEAPTANVAIVTHDGELALPSWDNCLPGITAQRMMQLAPEFYETGELHGVTSVCQRRVSLEEAKQAREVMLVGSSLPVMAVVSWDESLVGDGTPGLTTLALRAMIERDMAQVKKETHSEVPYGYLTGMLRD